MWGKIHFYRFKETFGAAFRAVFSNRLRSILTVSIIAIGITCLVGIQTAIDSLSVSVNESFGKMGTGRFSISACPNMDDYGGKRRLNGTELSINQLNAFYAEYSVPCSMAIYAQTGTGLEVKDMHGRKSNPVADVFAVKGNYLLVKGLDLEEGRYFSPMEEVYGERLCIIGASLRESLFGENDCIGSEIVIPYGKFRVAGVLSKVGSLLSGGMDNSVVVPMQSYLCMFPNNALSYMATIAPDADIDMEYAIDEAVALFRRIRRLSPSDENDFSIESSLGMENTLAEMKDALSAVALLVGLVTILGSMAGLMNIMIVSVRERIVEIGTCKALGATSLQIGGQFLAESVIIGQGGCVAGVALGVIAGNVAAAVLGTSLAIPWKWIGLSAVICLVVSVMAGVAPARRAAASDPVESLRHE